MVAWGGIANPRKYAKELLLHQICKIFISKALNGTLYFNPILMVDQALVNESYTLCT